MDKFERQKDTSGAFVQSGANPSIHWNTYLQASYVKFKHFLIIFYK